MNLLLILMAIKHTNICIYLYISVQKRIAHHNLNRYMLCAHLIQTSLFIACHGFSLQFDAFYSEKFSGRKLTWMHSFCTGL